MVMEVVHEDSVLCAKHPYRNSSSSSHGGICAFCLQEKLGKLISSSFPAADFPSSSSSSSPSFRSDVGCGGAGGGTGDVTLQDPHSVSSSAKSRSSGHSDFQHQSRRERLPFVHKKKKKEVAEIGGSDSVARSLPTPGRCAHVIIDEGDSPNRRGFWSFLQSNHLSAAKKASGCLKDSNFTPATPCSASTVWSSNSVAGSIKSKENKNGGFVRADEDSSPGKASFDRNISRSRSMGGSRNFPGTERKSAGYGDGSLRRAESQREGSLGKTQLTLYKNGSNNGLEGIKERGRYSGIFGGFMMSSSSSSSSYWVGSSVHDSASVREKSVSMGKTSHSRSKSWGWALASPMRALGKTPSRKKEEDSSSKSSTPNLSAIPSLLTVS